MNYVLALIFFKKNLSDVSREIKREAAFMQTSLTNQSKSPFNKALEFHPTWFSGVMYNDVISFAGRYVV